MLAIPNLSDVILHSINLPMLVVDGDNRLIEANSAAEEFLQMGRRSLMHQPLRQIFPPPCVLAEMLEKPRLTAASVSDQNIEIISLNHARVWVNLHLSPLLDRPDHVVILLQPRALAERLRGQEQFRGTARQLSSFGAMLAHEMKTPLAGIRGAAELLANSGEGADKLADLIIAESDRMTNLVARMESLSAGHSITPKPLNIHEVIDHCLNLAGQSFGAGYVFKKTFDPSLPEVSGDRDLLIQALTNIIKNACEASDKKDEIMIKTSYSLGEKLRLSADKKGAMLGVAVGNRGGGIPPELKPRIFEPFVTSKADGGGLGLALVASIAAEHGGSVDLHEADGLTIFQLNVPIVPIAAGGRA